MWGPTEKTRNHQVGPSLSREGTEVSASLGSSIARLARSPSFLPSPVPQNQLIDLKLGKGEEQIRSGRRGSEQIGSFAVRSFLDRSGRPGAGPSRNSGGSGRRPARRPRGCGGVQELGARSARVDQAGQRTPRHPHHLGEPHAPWPHSSPGSPARGSRVRGTAGTAGWCPVRRPRRCSLTDCSRRRCSLCSSIRHMQMKMLPAPRERLVAHHAPHVHQGCLDGPLCCSSIFFSDQYLAANNQMQKG
ncbi:hypothetical protein C2845_PM11G16980 [Panicum miliaceum]|uniref:Uncharacterized protein n=1 Tax=Panicum miliaceum TaxID=4540 RepID=A0A3L6RU08_PANMI|nr:hypothetical protein C2845_PM11G16980 [Panicum miliaceum]